VDPKHKRRSYAAREYYEPNANRSNLSLLTNALVSKIRMEKTDGEAKATGVQFIVDGATHSVKVKKEVIVCGGSVNSPQILELSGIGSPEVLQKAGVELVVANVGVGENLNDHTATALAVVSTQPTPLIRTA
jgi:choline dehydrogenase